MQEIENPSLLKDNIVSQFATFGLSFVKSTLKATIKTAGGKFELTSFLLMRLTFTIDLAKKGKSMVDSKILNRGTKQEEIEMSQAKILLELEERRAKALKDAYAFYRKNTAHIEILREDGGIEKTYFSIPPFCHAITKVLHQ